MTKKTVLPEGNIFGTKEDDEFKISFAGEEFGVFKRFEYLSIPFSITGNQELFKTILARAEKNNTSFADEISNDAEAQKIVDTVFEKMEASLAFSKQTLDFLLSRVYVDDCVLSQINSGDNFEDCLAQTIAAWKHLADFYCIEGLVGGSGSQNPFGKNGHSLVAGGIDALETVLPAMKRQMTENDWKEVCLKLSSVVERDYTQIDCAANVLGAVFGAGKELSAEEMNTAKNIVDELSKSQLGTNADIAKLTNSLIRFHNWLPIALKKDVPKGDAYDSVCVPARKAVELTGNAEIKAAVSRITDATSPKGLALATLVDENKIGDKGVLLARLDEHEKALPLQILDGRKDFAMFKLDDAAFYSGLCGGKWKGLKLLNDAKNAFAASYKVPNGCVISSLEIERMLADKGIIDVLKPDIFTLNDARRKTIETLVDSISFNAEFQSGLKQVADSVGENIIARSSMLGEDENSNFAGTYDSFACSPKTLENAIKEVIKSYLSNEAVKSREDVGLSHIPGISVIVQERISGDGGVLHFVGERVSLSTADTPENAVCGQGTEFVSDSIEAIVSGTALEKVRHDLHRLHNLFGDLDIEFVVDKNNDVYFTQLRPKQKIPEIVQPIQCAPIKTVETISDLANLKLESACIVRLNFLGRENIITAVGKIMDFIRQNKEYIVAVEGNMPSVAHIPNKIEGHFKIPYRRIEYDN